MSAIERDRKKTHRDTQKEGHMDIEKELGVISLPRDRRNHLKLAEARKDPPPTSLGGAWPC